MTLLDQLKQMTNVVIDTGDILSIAQYHPREATTNPSLIYAAAQLPQYKDLIKRVKKENSTCSAEEMMDALIVHFGCEILQMIPGRISTEIDAALSFDRKRSVEKARKIISLYEEKGVSRERVLIKLASTWEGIQAGTELEKEGIHCNLTLLFSLTQAVACAEGGITLISPFVGRILDWHKKLSGNEDLSQPDRDPGVLSVKSIYAFYKYFEYKTEVMGASFRNMGEILSLAGIDSLTISPSLLAELQERKEPLQRKLWPDSSDNKGEVARSLYREKTSLDESKFRWDLNQNQMATEKLSEGIRKFHEDSCRLQKLIHS